jgi:hypothetical protein
VEPCRERKPSQLRREPIQAAIAAGEIGSHLPEFSASDLQGREISSADAYLKFVESAGVELHSVVRSTIGAYIQEIAQGPASRSISARSSLTPSTTLQFCDPDVDFTSPTFGQISCTSVAPRIIQFALKFTF